jgi:signal transduction histidine kinase
MRVSGAAILKGSKMPKDIMAGQVGDPGLGRMNALLGTALAVNRVLLVREGRDELLRQICAAIVGGGVADRAWIVLSSRRGKLQAMAGAGLPESAQDIELAWRREGVPSCVQELMNSEGGPVRLMRSLASECGECRLGCDGAAGGGVAVRIEHRGRRFGVMSVVIPVAMAAVEEELGLFRDLAAGLGRALHEMGAERRRVAAVEALRRTQERLSLATSGTGIWDYDVVRDRLEWDAQMFRLFGVDPATFGHRLADWSRCLLPEALPEAMGVLAAAMRGEGEGRFASKFPVRLPDGGIRHLVGRGKVIFGDDGQALRIAGVNVDVTELVKAQEAMRASQDELMAIYENAPLLLILFDAELKVRKANRHWPDGLRRSVDEVVGKSCGDAFCCRHVHDHPDGCGHGEACAQCPIRQALQETLASGQPCNMKEVELASREGEVVVLMFSAARLEIRDEQMVLASALDITPQRREQAERAMLEDQLRQSQKMEAMGRLAGGVAHDFNNLLSVILGYAEMSLMRADTQGAQAVAMRQIAEAGRRSVELTRQLLSFSRRQALSPQVVDLGKAVCSQAKLLGRLIGEDIRIEVDVAQDVWGIYVDPGQIYQVLANLAVNARDAIPGVGTVSIQVGNAAMPGYFSPLCGAIPAGDYVRLVFRDTGSGIDPATRKRIFEPFFSTKLPEHGTGLGLSIVFNVVKQCGGDIQVNSQPGQGTAFSLLFPRHVAPVGKAAEGEALADAPPRGSETVLLVEDDELVLQLAGDILADLGYRVLAANGADAACEMARRHDGPLHLLLTDVIMPGVGGRELQLMVEAIRPGIRTLFMSGYSPDVLAGRGGFGEECSVVAIQKPFTVESLGRKVRETLDRG